MSDVKLTPNEQQMFDIIGWAFNGIADGSGICMELGWKKSKVSRVGANLAKKEKIEITHLPENLDGNIYTYIKDGNSD